MALIFFGLLYVAVFYRIHMRDKRKHALLKLGNLPKHIHGPYRR